MDSPHWVFPDTFLSSGPGDSLGPPDLQISAFPSENHQGQDLGRNTDLGLHEVATWCAVWVSAADAFRGGGGGVEWNWIKSFTRDRGARALGSLWVWEAETGGEHLVGLSP